MRDEDKLRACFTPEELRTFESGNGEMRLAVVLDVLGRLIAKNERLQAALREAMDVRHFCDMEGSGPETDPYNYDTYLRRWAEALGERVESTWPKAELYAEKRRVSVNERSGIAALLRRWYMDGFMQGFTCAGGVVTYPELAAEREGDDD